MNQLINVIVLIILSRINCEKVNSRYCVSEESREDQEINDIMHSHEELDESIEESNGNITIYDDSSKDFATTIKTPVNNDTTTIEAAACNDPSNINNEDSNESQSTLTDFPFSVSIQRKGAHYASGALVGKNWIVSVAGDFYNVRESIKLFRARLGSVDCKRGGSLVPLRSITIHPSYKYRKPNYDIALLRMAAPVEYSNFIRPIGMSKLQGKLVSAKFMTTYWPRIVINKKVLPEAAKERIKYNSMRVSTQKLIPGEMCSVMMKGFSEVLDNSSLCLKPVITHHSVCMPDVGAPVIAEDGLWAITSGWVSPSCPENPGPTLCTRVSSYLVRSWLNAHLLDL